MKGSPLHHVSKVAPEVAPPASPQVSYLFQILLGLFHVFSAFWAFLNNLYDYNNNILFCHVKKLVPTPFGVFASRALCGYTVVTNRK